MQRPVLGAFSSTRLRRGGRRTPGTHLGLSGTPRGPLGCTSPHAQEGQIERQPAFLIYTILVVYAYIISCYLNFACQFLCDVQQFFLFMCNGSSRKIRFACHLLCCYNQVQYTLFSLYTILYYSCVINLLGAFSSTHLRRGGRRTPGTHLGLSGTPRGPLGCTSPHAQEGQIERHPAFLIYTILVSMHTYFLLFNFACQFLCDDQCLFLSMCNLFFQKNSFCMLIFYFWFTFQRRTFRFPHLGVIVPLLFFFLTFEWERREKIHTPPPPEQFKIPTTFSSKDDPLF